MARTEGLPNRVAINARAEMAAQKRTAVDLAAVLGIGHRAALRRVNGEQEFTLGELAKTAAWLEVPVSALMAERASVAVAS